MPPKAREYAKEYEKAKRNTTIAIDMEEYKELLMIKGRYEELKERQLITTAPINRESYDFNKNITLCGGEALLWQIENGY